MKRHFSKTLIGVLTAALVAAPAAIGAKKKLHTIGDSTMANYPTDGSTDKRGWAQMLQQFFNIDNITVNNRAKSGASSKSYYKESAYWPTLVKGGSDEMQAGDYLLIQFAHNDEKNGGADGDTVKAYYTAIGDATTAASVDYRGTTASGTFKTYIRKYITEAKAMGVTPIVVGPICRKYFTTDGSGIRRNGRHDLGDSFTLCDGTTYSEKNTVAESNDAYDYVVQAKAVADEFEDVPFIDLTTLTAALYAKYGDAYCTSNLFCNSDATHTQTLGASLIARIFAEQLIKQAAEEDDAKKKAVLEGLAKDAIVSNEITFNPTSGNMGEGYVGMKVTKEYNVSAFGLSSETGTAVISASEGFMVSLDKAGWQQSITVPYDGSSLISTVYVRTEITSAGTTEGTLTVSEGSTSKSLPLVVNGISLGGGEEATCTWMLDNDLAAASESLSGSEASVSGLTAVSQHVTSGERTLQPFCTTTGTWPAGEIDEVSTRYVEFMATVPEGKTFSMDRISFYVQPDADSHASNMCLHAYYATKADFSDQQLITEMLNMTDGELASVSKGMVKKLEGGESVYIRIYPWVNTDQKATLTYLNLSEVTIHGSISNEGEETLTLTGNITYPFETAAPRDYVLSDMALGVGINDVAYSIGSSITDEGTRKFTTSAATGNGTMFSKFNAVVEGTPSTASDVNAITFTITPAEGYTFVPTALSFQAARAGTNGGSVQCFAHSGDASVEVSDSKYVLNTDKSDQTINTFNGEITGIGATAENPLEVKIHMIGFGKQKTLMLRNVVISGTMSGSTPTGVEMVSVNDEETTSESHHGNDVCRLTGIYTIDGRRLTSVPSHGGMYIVNGKKMIR